MFIACLQCQYSWLLLQASFGAVVVNLQCATCRLFNMGGPQRFSRADMAYELASFLHLDPEGIVMAAPAASRPRSVASPADISMNSSRLLAALDTTLTDFADALAQIKLDAGDVQ